MELVQTITELIKPILDSNEAELVDIDLKGPVGNQILKIFADTEAGITIDQCARLSRQISDAIDSENLIPSSYRLEVSSPGVKRPLKSKRDFLKNINREVKVLFVEAGEERHIQGKIKHATDGEVEISTELELFKIPLDRILDAKLAMQW